ncbi:hypothetical protein SBA6_150006 [Candidatus Sulfopaludibacter sp. SbA6]|nr:hypothetical protein SBA6_150006 [Candidatus Sulfopaludibacter sp. SbA6]
MTAPVVDANSPARERVIKARRLYTGGQGLGAGGQGAPGGRKFCGCVAPCNGVKFLITAF